MFRGPVPEVSFFFSQPAAGLTNRAPVRDSRAGTPLLSSLSILASPGGALFLDTWSRQVIRISDGKPLKLDVELQEYLVEVVSHTIFSRTFSIVLQLSRDIPTCSRPLSVCLLAIPICPVFFCCLLVCSVIRPFRVFCLFPSISLLLLVSFQFSILGSDRSESRSRFSIRLHSCSATIPFSVDLRVLLSSDLMTSVFPFELWSISYCSVFYIIPASYVVSR